MSPFNTNLSKTFQKFASEEHLQGISEHTLDAISQSQEGYSISKGRKFLKFHERIKKDLLQHRVITNNKFTAWFNEGNFSTDQLKAFVVQFTVFSNLFTVAQLYKTINADGIDSMRASKEILVNELGVAFRSVHENGNQPDDSQPENRQPEDIQPEDIQPEDNKTQFSSPEGTVEGGIFHYQAAHFEWILEFSESIGLEFNDVGKRRHGTKNTLFFCDELIRLYANEDYVTSQAASFSVENWAAAGFWKQLIKGLNVYQKRNNLELPIFFFTYHDVLEAQHAQHTLDELEDIYFNREIDEKSFIQAGNEMLDGVEVFWNGLNDLRKSCEDG